MAYDLDIAEKVRHSLAAELRVEERHMFGSLGFMVNGKLAVCVRDSNVMYKLGPVAADQALQSQQAEPVVMNGRQSKGWVYVVNDELHDDVFDRWLHMALSHNRETA